MKVAGDFLSQYQVMGIKTKITIAVFYRYDCGHYLLNLPN